MTAAVALTAPESDRLAACEATIERGFQTFTEVGTALLEVRDSRLYRAEFGTFEDYCRERWNLSRPYAYQVIEAARVVNDLSAIADTPLPTTESQARELVGLPSETAAAVMTAAAEATEGKATNIGGATKASWMDRNLTIPARPAWTGFGMVSKLATFYHPRSPGPDQGQERRR